MITSMFCFLILTAHATFSTGEADTIYVSTIGSKLYLNPGAAVPDFVLWKLSSVDDAKQAFATVKTSAATGSIQFQMTCNMVLRQISARDYSKENCYLVFSPRTTELQLEQPFHLKDSTKLFFTVSNSDQKDENEYSSVRVYVVPKNDDHMEICVQRGTKVLPLAQSKPTF